MRREAGDTSNISRLTSGKSSTVLFRVYDKWLGFFQPIYRKILLIECDDISNPGFRCKTDQCCVSIVHWHVRIFSDKCFRFLSTLIYFFMAILATSDFLRPLCFASFSILYKCSSGIRIVNCTFSLPFLLTS